MNKLRVVVMKEGAGNGLKVWVAQALDEDMAAQGEPDGTPLEAVEHLGLLFDARDAAIEEYRAKNESVEPIDPAPDSYFMLFSQGLPLGEFPLGASRMCEVRTFVK